jgi:hypothetical protein
MHTASAFIAVVLGLALTLGAVPAPAETVHCTPITAVPTIITVQGIYCFTQNLATSMTSGAAIEIQANNVILDLNGWKLGGQAAGLGTNAIGIYAASRQNITLKNGTVRGFSYGILLYGNASEGHIVEDIRADHNTYVGIEVDGHGNLIRNNLVIATGGTTAGGPNATAFGIFAGAPVSVLNNDVIDTHATGISTARGIAFSNVTGALAVNNRITNTDVGIEYANATGKYRDNRTTGVTTPFHGGTPVGINPNN